MGSMRMTVSLFCAAALLAEEGKPTKPVLVHSDAACFVHALRAMPEVSRERFARAVDAGLALVHTARASGEMVVLVPATGTVEVNTRRISYGVTRIVGVAADRERLYVLLWTARAYDAPPDAGATVEGGSYRLHASWLADGSALAAPALGADGLPKAAPVETVEAGPLRLVEGGVECYGTRALYAGRDPKR
jgi:hypothetical protein